MMKLATITFAVIAVVAQSAQAGHFGFGRGGPGLGGHHGESGFDGFGRGDGLEFLGGFGLDTERLQTRFESKFDDLMSDYDMGIANVEDFYNSDDYTDAVDGVELLVDRYDLFLGGVERSIERLGDFISIANDDLTYYEELIADYEARDDLSEERLARILDRLTNVQDHLTTKIDFLTEKQSTLTDNFGSYELFSTDLSTYLGEIVTAGDGTIDDATDDSAASLLSTSPLRSISPLAASAEEITVCEMSESLAATVVPEPAASLLSIIALGSIATRRPNRPRRAT